jgi:signal transduction histidine kinase
MRRVFTSLFCIISLSLVAQNEVLIDSLRKELRQAASSDKFQIWNAIGFEYRYSYPDSTIYYCNLAFDLGKSLKLTKDLSKPLSFIGLATANKGDYKTSIDYHRNAIDIASAQNDSTQLAFGYNNLGRMFFDQGDLVRAYDNFIRSKDIFESNGDASGLAYVYRSLANLYRSQSDFSKAIETSTKALELRKKIGDFRTLTSAFLELGLVYQAAGNTKAALEQFREADLVATKINDRVTKAELHLGMAEILFETGDHKGSFASAQEVLNIISNETNQRLFMRATLLLGRYYVEEGQYQRALPYLNKVMAEAEQSGTLAFQRDAAFYKAEIYKKLNDKNSFNEFSNKYKILSEMLVNTDLTRQIERLQFQLEIEKKERENDGLKARQAQDSALIAKQRVQNILLIIIVISVTAIAFISWTNSRKRRSINHKLALQNAHIVVQREEISNQNENLSRNNQDLQDLNQEKNTLMNIVAHDLKSPLNRIYGLANIIEMEGGIGPTQKGYVEMIKNATRSGLDLITDLLDVNALEEVKDLPKQTEVSVEDLFKEKINSYQEAAAAKSIQLIFENEVNRKIRTDANYLGRILDNLLSNAIKFSDKNSTVLVASSLSKDNLLTLKIRDHGPGFVDADRQFLFQKFKKLSARPTGGESSNGLGLAIVKTLVDRLSGNINLISAAGKGSEFIITISVG